MGEKSQILANKSGHLFRACARVAVFLSMDVCVHVLYAFRREVDSIFVVGFPPTGWTLGFPLGFSLVFLWFS